MKNDCPLWQAPCKEHECRWYIQIMGQNPNTGQPINKWDCSMTLLPVLVIETAQQSRQAGASADKVANEIRNLHLTVVGQRQDIKKVEAVESGSIGAIECR